jgi:hypothetical protein
VTRNLRASGNQDAGYREIRVVIRASEYQGIRLQDVSNQGIRKN